MVDNIGMDHRWVGPNGNIRKLDDVRDPVGCDTYFNVGGQRKKGLRRGNEVGYRRPLSDKVKIGVLKDNVK